MAACDVSFAGTGSETVPSARAGIADAASPAITHEAISRHGFPVARYGYVVTTMLRVPALPPLVKKFSGLPVWRDLLRQPLKRP